MELGVTTAIESLGPQQPSFVVPRPSTVAVVAVGTRVSPRAPRTEPYERLSRIRLPPRVCNGKATARPRMEDDRLWEPGIHKLRHPCPGHSVLLAATP